ncbi:MULTISPECIES: hypothetical protein [Streptomyces]|uniref:Uncharacterized protein n=1 Tax=Streptomyces salyersiae TaxID=3075530 RepID=A0ABU2RMI8_9ACTN|nr:hypothetical protein [Streptomyces sp. DSM 41770]MDT0429139.1 hypothetical protein [Streptomyces sp. DSM 41770]
MPAVPTARTTGPVRLLVAGDRYRRASAERDGVPWLARRGSVI